MILLFGPCEYTIAPPSEGLLLSQVDFSYTPCVPPSFSLQDMFAQYPDYRRLIQTPDTYTIFHDRFALVRFTAKGLPQYMSFDLPLQTHFLSMTLNYLMTVISCAVQERTDPSYQYNRHVRYALQYIHENYMCNISAEDIASYIGVHTGHLHRLFRTEMGTRVTEYLINLRIEKAKTLLKRTDIPICDIIGLIGVSTQQYFSRLFKKHVGMTPLEYRGSYNTTCNYRSLDDEITATIISGQSDRMEP